MVTSTVLLSAQGLRSYVRQYNAMRLAYHLHNALSGKVRPERVLVFLDRGAVRQAGLLQRVIDAKVQRTH